MKSRVFAALAASVILSASAVAAPITYSFITGPQAFATGNGVGILPTGLTASGTFTYDSAAPYIQPGNNGAGRVYAGAITNFSINIGSFSASDTFGYGFAANDLYYVRQADGTFLPQARDLLEFYAGPTGGVWNSNDLYGREVARIRFYWNEGYVNTPDFMNDELLPGELPSGLYAGLSFDLGPSLGGNNQPPFSGVIGLSNFRVTRVPEPQTLALLMVGMLALAFVRRRAAR